MCDLTTSHLRLAYDRPLAKGTKRVIAFGAGNATELNLGDDGAHALGGMCPAFCGGGQMTVGAVPLSPPPRRKKLLLFGGALYATG